MTKQTDIDELLNNAKNRIERPDMVFVADIFKDYETLKSLISENEYRAKVINDRDGLIKELRKDLYKANQLLDDAFDENPIDFGMGGMTPLYDEQVVNQAHRILSKYNDK